MRQFLETVLRQRVRGGGAGDTGAQNFGWTEVEGLDDHTELG